MCRLAYGNSDFHKYVHSCHVIMPVIQSNLVFGVHSCVLTVKHANLCLLPVVFCLISGGVAILRDHPILAPVQKRNNFLTVFNTRKGIIVEVHVVLPKEKKNPPVYFHQISKVLIAPRKREAAASFFLKTSYIPICDKCLYGFPINIAVWSYMRIRYSVERLYSILNPLHFISSWHYI